MKKSLFTSIFIWIAAGSVYYYFLHGKFEPPADWICAIVGGSATAIGIGCLRSLFLAFQDKYLINNSRQSRLPNTKKLIAISGRIIAIGKPLKTPFTEQDTVLYNYDIFDHHLETVRDSNDRSRTESRSNTVLTGHELTPCEIQSNWGNVKLLSYPSLEGFDEEFPDKQEASSKAKEFVARTKFEDLTGMQVMKVIREAGDLYSDSDGTISKHLQLSKKFDIEELNYKEQFVRNGEEVCAVGYFDPQKQGIIPDHLTGAGICRLYRGGQKLAAKSINMRIYSLFLASMFFLVIINAGIFFGLKRYDSAEIQISKRTSRLINAINSEDSEKIKAISKFSIDINMVNSSGQTPLMLARDGETAKILIDKGANLELKDSNGRTALMIATQYSRADVVDELIKARATLNNKDNYNYTALNMARDNNEDVIEKALLNAGANDDGLSSANAVAIDINSKPVQVCFSYIQAIHKEDREKMKVLSTSRPDDFFETVRFDIWKETRPTNPVLLNAFQKDNYANVQINGGPGTYNLDYRLVEENGSWKIEKENVTQ